MTIKTPSDTLTIEKIKSTAPNFYCDEKKRGIVLDRLIDMIEYERQFVVAASAPGVHGFNNIQIHSAIKDRIIKDYIYFGLCKDYEEGIDLLSELAEGIQTKTIAATILRTSDRTRTMER